MWTFGITVILLQIATNCDCDKFLIMHPFYSGSHVLTLHHVAEALVNRGHQVVTLRLQDSHQFKLKDLGSSHREILLAMNNTDGSIPLLSQEAEGKFRMPVELLWEEGLSLSTVFKLPKNPWNLVSSYCHFILSNETLKKELEAEHFNVAIVDLIYNECGLALASHVLKLPTMAYWAFSFSSGEAEFTTMATPPSHIPAFMSRLTDTMSFNERMWNSAIKFFFARPFMLYHTWVTDGVISRYYPQCPKSSFLLSDLNGAMINTNFILDYPRLQPITFINVGGMQISEKPKKLPQDLQEFLDSGSEHGVILFTMGFIFQPNAVPNSRIQAMFDAFSQLPQKVIMKLDDISNEPDLKVPKNVLLKSFLPQQDILAHRNLRLFITHCGMHGVMEAIFHAVPMVGMPVFVDQGDVLTRMEQKEIGVGIDKWATTSEIVDAVNEVINNKKYHENIKKLSELMKIGMKQKPMENAIWWLEYLSLTNGAEHLKLSSRHLNFIQYYSLDFCILLLILGIFMYKIFSCLWQRKIKQKQD